jgi:superfamily II DNA or RNA helicase
MTRQGVFESSLDVMKDIQHRNRHIEIRQEQLDALDAITENQDAGNNATLLSLATGAGKTLIAAADTLRRMRENPGARGLFLCDSNYILNNSLEEFRDVIGPEFSMARYDQATRVGALEEQDIIFDTFQAMGRHKGKVAKDAFTFGVVDESHHAKAETYEKTLGEFIFSDHLLGVTATVDRLDTLDIRDIFGQERFKYSLGKGIIQRRLAAVDYHIIADAIILGAPITDTEGYQYSKRDFERVYFAPKRDEEMVRIAQRYAKLIPGRGGGEALRRAGFCKSIEHAETMAALFTEMGDESLAFHSKQSPRQRDRAYTAFREGGITGLFTVSMMDEGVNIPEINQACAFSETNSKRIFLQRLGRGLRRTDDKRRLQALDFAANAERLLLVDRVWKQMAQDAGIPEPREEQDLYNIEIGSLNFSETTINALKMLRTVDQNIYRADQAVPEGSYLATRLGREVGATKGAVLTIAKSMGIKPQAFPRQSGSAIPYFLKDDVARIREKIKTLFPENN